MRTETLTWLSHALGASATEIEGRVASLRARGVATDSTDGTDSADGGGARGSVLDLGAALATMAPTGPGAGAQRSARGVAYTLVLVLEGLEVWVARGPSAARAATLRVPEVLYRVARGGDGGGVVWATRLAGELTADEEQRVGRAVWRACVKEDAA